jgi:hypothetical protein
MNVYVLARVTFESYRKDFGEILYFGEYIIFHWSNITHMHVITFSNISYLGFFKNKESS